MTAPRQARRERASGATIDEVDLTDLDLWARGVPYDWFRTLRDESPIHWQPEADGAGFWAVTRYDDIVTVSRDWATYSSETGGTSLQDLDEAAVEARRSMLDTDPPRHSRLRAIVNKAFTPRALDAFEPRIRSLAHEIIERALRQPEFDFVADVAAELPMWVLPEIMGLPLEDRRHLIELSDKLLGHTDPEVAGSDPSSSAHRLLPFSSPVALEIFAYGRELAAARRRKPQNDVITALVQAEVDGDHLSEREFELFFLLLVTAGNETTRHTISHGLLALFDHPDAVAELRANPSLSRAAADEILRWATPVHHFRRTATRTVSMRGTTIHEGDKVTIWYVSGNRDERQFVEPDQFDTGRSTNRHLAFGLGGPHFCLGAYLARLEVRIWLEEILPYVDRLEVAGDVIRLRSNMFNGIRQLPVRFSA